MSLREKSHTSLENLTMLAEAYEKPEWAEILKDYVKTLEDYVKALEDALITLHQKPLMPITHAEDQPPGVDSIQYIQCLVCQATYPENWVVDNLCVYCEESIPGTKAAPVDKEACNFIDMSMVYGAETWSKLVRSAKTLNRIFPYVLSGIVAYNPT